VLELWTDASELQIDLGAYILKSSSSKPPSLEGLLQRVVGQHICCHSMWYLKTFHKFSAESKFLSRVREWTLNSYLAVLVKVHSVHYIIYFFISIQTYPPLLVKPSTTQQWILLRRVRVNRDKGLSDLFQFLSHSTVPPRSSNISLWNKLGFLNIAKRFRTRHLLSLGSSLDPLMDNAYSASTSAGVGLDQL